MKIRRPVDDDGRYPPRDDIAAFRFMVLLVAGLVLCALVGVVR